MISQERRTYRFHEFVFDSLAWIVSWPLLVRAAWRRRVSAAFESKLMLTVTAVNGCRYCGWFHSRLAEHRDVPSDEVKALLSGVIDRGVADDEAAGLLFAQHYAESNRLPSPEAVARLRRPADAPREGLSTPLRALCWAGR